MSTKRDQHSVHSTEARISTGHRPKFESLAPCSYSNAFNGLSGNQFAATQYRLQCLINRGGTEMGRSNGREHISGYLKPVKFRFTVVLNTSVWGTIRFRKSQGFVQLMRYRLLTESWYGNILCFVFVVVFCKYCFFFLFFYCGIYPPWQCPNICLKIFVF